MFKLTNKYQPVMIAVDMRIGEDLPAPALSIIRTFADEGESFYVADGDRRILIIMKGDKFPTIDGIGRVFIYAVVKLCRSNGKATGEDQRVFLRANVRSITATRNKEIPNLTLSELVALAPSKRSRGGNRGGAGRPKKVTGQAKVNKSISLSAAHWKFLDPLQENYSKGARELIESSPGWNKK